MRTISNFTEIPDFKHDDFLDSLRPYEFVYSFRNNRFEHTQILQKVAKIAQREKVRGFMKMYGEYVKDITGKSSDYQSNVTQFEDQEIELVCGKWMADEMGITCEGAYGEEIQACSHPITITERLSNIDTGIEKVRLSYKKGKGWRSTIVDKKTIASSNLIVGLADCGISVTTETSKYLVKYLHDIENENLKLIPEKDCVSRLGWIDDQGFSPYVEDLVFDGDANFKVYFESVKSKGDFEEWKKTVEEARNNSVVAKIMLAASFASVLVKPLGLLPFIVHTWGGTEVGKTVGLMLAASVWANPELGLYIHSFNSTAVGRERSAAFVNNLPLIMDELQIVKDKKQFDQDIYMLCEGAGKVRGNKSGGTDKTPTWSNCILTSGEMPITNANSGGGAVNRILEIECKEAIFKNPREFCSAIKKNYGYAGREWISFIENNTDSIHKVYKFYLTKLSENDTTEKQAMAGAAILTADYFISSLFFNKDSFLQVDDIAQFLQKKKDVSANERGYEFLCSWVSQNFNKFRDDSLEIYGKLEENYSHAYIINTVFYKACDEAGFNSTALISYLKDKKLIETSKNETMKFKRIKGVNTRCLCLKLIDDGTAVFT